jgi:hypothetical protein
MAGKIEQGFAASAANLTADARECGARRGREGRSVPGQRN